MSVDVNEVEALTFDDFGDDVDELPAGSRAHRSNDEENMPPKRLVLNRPLGGGGGPSRPMTAGSTFSELEELSLDGLSVKPQKRTSRELGGGSFGGMQPQSPMLAAVVPRGLQSPRGLQNSMSPPWSPASMNIPTLDEFPEGPPGTPSRRNDGIDAGIDELSVAVPDTGGSPTSSEKAKAGCAVM